MSDDDSSRKSSNTQNGSTYQRQSTVLSVEGNGVVQQRRLTCYFKTENGNGETIPDLSNRSESAFLVQEEGKKSSFLLEPSDDASTTTGNTNTTSTSSVYYTVQKPANIFIEYDTSSTDNHPFFLGGFQMVSTAKSIEIYLTDMEGKESYLTTSKGISFNKEDKTAPWHKAICVVPGGPRPILRLRIKLLSLRPSETTTAKLQSMKLTARIAEPPSPVSQSTLIAEAGSGVSPGTDMNAVKSSLTSTSRVASSPTGSDTTTAAVAKKIMFFDKRATNPLGPLTPTPTSPSKLSSSSPTMTQSDLGAAMASVSFMSRSTEKAIEETLSQQTKKMEQMLDSSLLRMEQQMLGLKSAVAMQQQLLQENHKIMTIQQQTIEQQSLELKQMLKYQEDLKVRVQSLQADMSVLRYHRPQQNNTSNNNNTTTTSEKKKDKTERSKVRNSQRIIPGSVEPEGQAFVGELSSRGQSEDDDNGDTVSGTVHDQIVGIESFDYTSPSRDARMENVVLKDLIRKAAKEIDEKPIVGCGAMINEKPLACGAMNEPFPVAESFDSISPSNRDIQMENIVLRDLIRKAATEIDEKPDVGCGPMIQHDKCLFNGMMLSTEDLLLKQMNSIKLPKETMDALNFQESRNTDGYGSVADEEEMDDEEEDNEETDGVVNIEVTLFEDEDREVSMEGSLVDGGVGVEEEHPADEDVTVARGSAAKKELFDDVGHGDGFVQEKKEMDPSDVPDYKH